jgi:hypothetical protein
LSVASAAAKAGGEWMFLPKIDFQDPVIVIINLIIKQQVKMGPGNMLLIVFNKVWQGATGRRSLTLGIKEEKPCEFVCW